MLSQLQQKLVLFLTAILVPAVAISAQRDSDPRLFVNGQSTEASVLRINGRSYVDIETVALLTHGTVTFQSNHVLLSIPSAVSSPPPAPSAPSANGMSREFASSAIATLTEMKEWKGVVGTMVTFGLAVDDKWALMSQDRVAASLEQTTAAASTNADRSALQLLSTQFANLAKWESEIVAERKDLNGARIVTPNALQNDPVLIKFSNCGRFLSVMLGSGVFGDNPSCD